jgi:hypothetical protein
MSEEKRTQFAMQALGFADLFNFKVGDQKVSGHRVELSAPEGPSTGGGKQAVQHVKLIPADESGAVIVAGSANQVEKTAELRTFEYLADLHAKRFKGAALPIDKAQYNLLIARVKAFFADQRLAVSLLDLPRSAGTRSDVSSGSSAGMMAAVVALVAMVAGGVVYFLMHAKH